MNTTQVNGNAEIYAAFKATCVNVDLIRQSANLRDIDVTGLNSVTPSITLNGTPLGVTSEFIGDLCSILRIGSNMQKLFDRKVKKKVAGVGKRKKTILQKETDMESKLQMINAIKAYILSNSKVSHNVVLYANPVTKKIVTVGSSDSVAPLSTNAFFTIIDKVVSLSPSLIVHDAMRTDKAIVVNIVSTRVISYPGLGENEAFKFGISFIKDSRSTRMYDFNVRQLTGHGMIGAEANVILSEGKSARELTMENINTFLRSMRTQVDNAFEPDAFEAKVLRCKYIFASFNEVLDAYLEICSYLNSNIGEQYVEQAEFSILNNHFPELVEVNHKLAKYQIDADDLGFKGKYIKTRISIWDLFNKVTSFGNSDNGYEFTQGRSFLKAKAGTYLSPNQFDLEYAYLFNI